MIKKTYTYSDYNGVQCTEDFYFNLSKTELIEMDSEYPEGFSERIKQVMESDDKKEMIRIFKDLILRSYGKKSEDGKRFIKSKEITEGFEQSPAFDEIFMEIGFNSESASNFVNGLIPSDLQNAVKSQMAQMQQMS